MDVLDVIAKKREGFVLSREEIEFFVQGVVTEDIPEYQVAAWLMAVYIRGMNIEETTYLTDAMARSGRTLDVEKITPLAVDKHSTGGVGDKTTLVVAPLVAAAGLPVAKMSGRGLGFTGGTLDKLESFPGFTTDLSPSEFLDNLRSYGIVVAGQTSDLVPADRKLYALRNATATTGSVPLIASSIMSKKLAVGARAIVLDVKVGKGAFMQTDDEARELARTMIDLGENLGKKVTAVISDMNQPLGSAVGNALEVNEAIDTLQGVGPADFTSLCLAVATQMVLLSGQGVRSEEVQTSLERILRSGEAIAKLRELVRAQGGNAAAIEDPTLLPQAEITETVQSVRDGYVSQLDAREVGLAALDLGAGRKAKEEPVDHAVGIVLHKKIGDHVSAKDALVTIHAQNRNDLKVAKRRLLAAYGWQDEPVQPPPLIHDVLD